MALYRALQTSFWQDAFVLDLTPEEKYFFIYLMTNSKTSQCGIYELPKRIIETETGYNRETVDKLIQRFVEYGKIEYDEKSKEIIILNWAKYNFSKSPKVISCIKKELQSVKNTDFVSTFINSLKHYGYSMETVSIEYGEKEKEKEKEKEEGKEKQKEVVNVHSFYESNFGMLNPFISESLTYHIEDSSEELVLEAMKIALLNGKSWKYAEGVLLNWKKNNVKTVEDAKALDVAFQNSKGGQNAKNNRSTVPEEYNLNF